MWFGPFGFSGSFGAASGFARAVVAAFGVDGQGANDFAGDGVDDSDVVAVDEGDDAGSVEGSTEADVVHLAVHAQTDAARVDAVAADSELAVDAV